MLMVFAWCLLLQKLIVSTIRKTPQAHFTVASWGKVLSLLPSQYATCSHEGHTTSCSKGIQADRYRRTAPAWPRPSSHTYFADGHLRNRRQLLSGKVSLLRLPAHPRARVGRGGALRGRRRRERKAGRPMQRGALPELREMLRLLTRQRQLLRKPQGVRSNDEWRPLRAVADSGG